PRGKNTQDLWTPGPPLGLPPPSRRRQRDEHRRLAAGDGHVQRVPAEQPPPFAGLPAFEPRRIGIRLWIHGRQDHEGPRARGSDAQRRRNPEGRPAAGLEVLAPWETLPSFRSFPSRRLTPHPRRGCPP